MIDMVKTFLDKTSGLKEANIKEVNNLAFNLWRYFEKQTIQKYKDKYKLKSTVKNTSHNISHLLYRSYNNIFNCSFILNINNNQEIKLFEVDGLTNINSVASSDSNDLLDYEAPGSFYIKNEALYFKPNRTDLKELSTKYYVFITGVINE